MRMLVIRLFYVLVGAVLAVGVAMSALRGPEPTLVAAESCYSACPSLTAMSLSSPTVTYGSQQAVVFRVGVGVSPPGGAAPTGDVAVQAGIRTLCMIRLLRGVGSCSLDAWTLSPGRYQIRARYAGDANYQSSTSSREILTVLRPSATGLSLSWLVVPYGGEEAVDFQVVVGGGASGTVPTGDVAVQSGGRTLCMIRLSRGMGSCSPSPRALPSGWNAIMARYRGDASFASSTSGLATLLVL